MENISNWIIFLTESYQLYEKSVTIKNFCVTVFILSGSEVVCLVATRWIILSLENLQLQLLKSSKDSTKLILFSMSFKMTKCWE